MRRGRSRVPQTEKQGKRAAAIRTYAEPLASSVATGFGDSVEKDGIRGRLRRLMGSSTDLESAMKAAIESLSRARTIRFPKPVKGGGSAQFLVLFSTGGKVDEVKYISGDESFRSAGDALRAALAGKLNPHVPLNAPVKLVRRGIVFCSATSTACDIALMTPDTVRSVN